MRDVLAEHFFFFDASCCRKPSWSSRLVALQRPRAASTFLASRSGRCGAFRCRHQDPPLHHKCREGGHHANRDTACPLEGMHTICGRAHSSPAVHSMMRDQVVLATRGLAELYCCSVLGLTRRISTIFIGCCRPGRPTRHYSVVLPAARTAIVGRVRYSGVITLDRVEMVTRDFGTAIQGISLLRTPLYRDHDCCSSKSKSTK